MHHLDSRAVGIGDDPVLLIERDILWIDFWHDKGHIGIHSKMARVVNHYRPGFDCTRHIARTHASARREKRDLYLLFGKDFIGGSEDTKRQASAVINASQYSMIFSLAPNDISDLVNLYRNAGEINKGEQDTIVTAERGCCFFIASPYSRTTFYVRANDTIRKIAKI